jgi:hypothetical protein
MPVIKVLPIAAIVIEQVLLILASIIYSVACNLGTI